MSPRSIRAMAHLAARACFFARTGCRRFDLHCRGDRRVHAMSRAAGRSRGTAPRSRTHAASGWRIARTSKGSPQRAMSVPDAISATTKGLGHRSAALVPSGQASSRRPMAAYSARHSSSRAEFCSSCHQFDAALAVNGKPLENTVAEWQASPQASQGVTCQTCHMPDRQHLWRGIHDPAMVASGLTTHITADAAGVRFEYHQYRRGPCLSHLRDPEGCHVCPGSGSSGVAAAGSAAYACHRPGRPCQTNERWIEVSDSRLLPGQSAAIELPWNASERIQVLAASHSR